MAFAERILGQIVRGDGSLAAHLHHCPYIAIGTKYHIPRPKCNCLHPVWDPHTARDRRPTTIEIEGTPFTNTIDLVMHYHKEWIPPNISFFNCLSILFDGISIYQIDCLHLYNCMRNFAMESLGTGQLPKITDKDIQILTNYFRTHR